MMLEIPMKSATKALREGRRAARVAGRLRPRRLGGPIAMRVTENLVARIEGGIPHHCCVNCDADLGPMIDNYKDHCIREDNPVSHAVPLSGDPQRFIDAAPLFRQFFCPGCGTLIENEIALATDPLLRDITVILDERLAERRPQAAD